MKTCLLSMWFALILLVNCYTCIGQNSDLPNIIFILADDLGYGDVQSLNPDSKIPTPNLNALASQGLSFTNAHAPSSVCTPTRYSFLTGRYSWRSRMKKGVCWTWDPPLIEEDRFTIGKMLQQQGYATACIGKWHLGWDWPTTDKNPVNRTRGGENVDYSMPIKSGPTTRGFDYYFGQDIPGLPPHVLIDNNRVVAFPQKWFSGPQGLPGAMSEGWDYENLLQTISEKAVEYVVQQVQDSRPKPFFLYYSLTAPHTPIAPHNDFKEKTEVGPYGDFVNEMDFHVGKIIRTVDSLGIADDTIIIFTSDNGGVNQDGKNYSGRVGSLLNQGHNSNGMLRGLKSDAWEGGHKVPFIIKWPGHIDANSTSSALISHVDMMATFAAISGAALPPHAGEDSYNMLPAFKDPGVHNIRESLVTQSGNGILAIQKGDWKLILSSGGGGSWTHPTGKLPVFNIEDGENEWENIQLYNLKIDLAEIQNVASNHKEIVAELMVLLKEYVLNGRSHDAGSGPLKNKEQLWPEVEWINQLL